MIAVKIKSDKYGSAIGLLIRSGGGFQTRYEDMLIVDREQLRMLKEAGFVEGNHAENNAEKNRATKKK